MTSTQTLTNSALCRYALLLLVFFSAYQAAAANSTSTTVASSQTTITLGDTVTFTATVTTSSGTPTGLVTFFDGATPLGSGTLAVVLGNDQATFSTSILSASGSPHSITATYQGDSNFTSSTSTAITQTVNARASTTGVVLNPTTVFVGQPSTATVTVTDAGSSTPPGTPDTFSATGAPATGRTGFTATLFGDGLVLVAGGQDANNIVLQSVEIYSVSGAAFTATGNLNTARTGAVAVLLPNGKILIAGGSSDGTANGALNTAELFDPVARTFSVAGGGSSNAMRAAHFEATATLLSNGQVLLAGGANSGGVLNSAELYNPATDTFTSTANLNTARAGATATLLGSGKVLIAGGSSDGTSAGALNTAELFDPTGNSNAGTFTAITSTLSSARWQPEAALLGSGKVLLASGQNSFNGLLVSADLYDPVANTFTASSHSMTVAHFNGSAVALPNGTVLLAGGTFSQVVELYDPESDQFHATGSLVNSDNGLISTLLNNGDVLVVGLIVAPAASDAELYSPSFNPSGTVGFSSSEATDTFGSACALTPSTSTASTCTSTVTPTKIGSSPHTITSTYPADAVHSTSNNTASLTVTVAATTTSVSSSLNPSVAGQSVTFTATVTNSSGSAAPPTGTVQFVVDGSNLGSPVALTPAGSNSSSASSQSTSTLTVGTHSVTANYVNADGSFTSSTGTLSGGQVVTAFGPPTIAKGFNPSGIQPNTISTLTITITNPSSNTVALTGLAFIDNFPANVVVAATPNLTNTCGGTATAAAGSSSLALSGGTVAVNTSCAVTVNVTSAFIGTYLNTTGAVGSNEGGSGGTASATLAVAFPPTISKLFEPATINQNQTSLLSFTINNPNSNSTPPNSDVTLTGISFTDTLPAGLVIANPNNLSNNCDGTVTANPGSSTITLTGGDLGPAVGLINIRPRNPLLSTRPSLKPLQSKASRPTQSAGAVRGGPQQPQQPSASGSCFISVEVQPNTNGTFNNTTGVISANESGAGATSNTATLTVTAAAPVQPPTVAKAFGASSVPLNGTTSLTLTLGNPNSGTTFLNVGVDDLLPSGLTPSSSSVSGSCLADSAAVFVNGNDINTVGTTLPPNTSCTVIVNVTGTTVGVQNNTTGNVSADYSTGSDTTHITGGSASASIIVVSPPSIAKAFNPTTIALNGTSALTFTITNPAANTVAQSGVAFSDTLPTGLVVSTPNGLTSTCGGTVTATSGTTGISLTGGSVAVSSTCTVAVNVTGTASGQYTNTTGAVSSTNGGTGNTASANLTVASPPSISKAFGAATIPLTGTTSLTFNISNPNTGMALTGVAFTDSLPAGLVVATPSNLNSSCGGTATAVSGSGSVSLSGGTLATSASCTVTVNVQGTTAGQKNNSVTVSSNEGGTGNTANASITVVAPPTISKTFGAASIPLNGSTSLSFTISNANAFNTLTGIGFSDTLPAGLIISTPNGLTGSCGAGTITATQNTNLISLSGASLAASSSCTFSVNVTGTAAGFQNNTTSTVSSNEGGSGTAASASILVVLPPTIAKAFTPGAIDLSQTTSLGFTITNPAANPVALTGVGFTDVLPSGLTTANGSSTVCGGTLTTSGGNTISLSGATIAANGTCTFNVTVTPTQFGNYTNTTGNVTSGNGGTGNTATANLTVVSIVISPTSVNFGDVDSQQIVAASISITNTGSTAVPLSLSLTAGTGANANNFAAATNCPSSLGANQSCTVEVVFVAPNVTSASQLGISTATLTVSSSGTFTQPVPLQANVIDPEPRFNPASLSFGNQSINTSTTLTTQLSNAGLTALNIQSITIGGTNPADFAAQSFCPASLAPGSSCNINVTFTPLVKGSLSATLILTSNDGTATVPLSGNGKQNGAFATPLSISADAPTVQVSAGGTASIGLNVTAEASEGTLALTWTGALPSGVTVSLNPASIDATSTNQSSTSQSPNKVTLTVAESGSATMAQNKRRTPPLYAALFPVLGIVGLALGRKRRKSGYLALVFAGLMVLFLVAGCGGRVTPPTPSSAGTFSLNVTVTSMSTGHSASTNVTVQLM